MTDASELVTAIVRQALTGRGAHVETLGALDGLDWKLAGERPDGDSHSIFQIVNHLVYWQEFALQWLGGDKPRTPEHAELSWPGDEQPATAAEWEGAVARFRSGLESLAERAGEGSLAADLKGKTALEILQLIASHNSYHVGQVAALRRRLGAWPPPGGGATW